MIKKNWLPILLILFGWCGCRSSLSWHKTSFLFFDTLCEVNLFCSAADFNSSRETIRDCFAFIEGFFSPSSDHLDSPEVTTLFNKALSVYYNSAGSFDITVAPLSILWGFRTGEYKVPEKKEIAAALKSIGMAKIRQEKNRIRLGSGMALDWGGIAKGYGIDLAALALQKKGVTQGFVNAGGDLFCWGKNPAGNLWRIGIKHPRESGFLGVLKISGVGAATTGDYQRFFIRDNIRYHHVFDPRTGYPAGGKQSVTVVGPETCICDALSTALFVSKNPSEVLKRYPEYGAIIVDEDGKISLKGKSFSFSKE